MPVYSAVYGSTETTLGVNLWPKEDPVYLPLLSAAFFEFIPVDHCYEEQPQVSYVPVKLKLQHPPPPGIPRAFDRLAFPGVEFDPHA